jgi:hypothetical protein
MSQFTLMEICADYTAEKVRTLCANQLQSLLYAA